MKKSLKGSLRGNNAKKVGKSCFNVKNYFHISVSHVSYKIKIFLNTHKSKIIVQNYHPPIRQ